MKIFILVFSILFLLSSCKDKVNSDTQSIAGSNVTFEANKDMIANIYTSKGKIRVGLEFVRTPMTVANFVALAEGKMTNKVINGRPFYDGLTFHRVVNDFMIQGGDPSGDGTGNAGYQFPNEIHEELSHDGPGILSMANSGENTNSCQFFITHTKTEWLNGKHTVFGKVIEGQEIVNKIVQGDRIDSIRIERLTDDAKNFDAPKVFISQKNIIREKQFAYYQNTPMYKAFEEYVKKTYPQAVKDPCGLYYFKSETNTELPPLIGNYVKVHYKGMLTNGKVFDESISKGEPFTFQIGAKQVIPGWDEGVPLLNKGESGTLILPSYLAYGEQGAGGLIGPNETLIFEVKLLDIK